MKCVLNTLILPKWFTGGWRGGGGGLLTGGGVDWRGVVDWGGGFKNQLPY